MVAKNNLKRALGIISRKSWCANRMSLIHTRRLAPLQHQSTALNQDKSWGKFSTKGPPI